MNAATEPIQALSISKVSLSPTRPPSSPPAFTKPNRTHKLPGTPTSKTESQFHVVTELYFQLCFRSLVNARTAYYLCSPCPIQNHGHSLPRSYRTPLTLLAAWVRHHTLPAWVVRLACTKPMELDMSTDTNTSGRESPSSPTARTGEFADSAGSGSSGPPGNAAQAITAAGQPSFRRFVQSCRSRTESWLG